MLPPPDTSGRLPKTNLRQAVNAMLYRRKTGCPRAMLPRDFGVPPRTALWWFAKFARLGAWPTIQEAMIGPTREACDRAAEPELVCIDFPHGEVRGISARDSERCECNSLANA